MSVVETYGREIQEYTQQFPRMAAGFWKIIDKRGQVNPLKLKRSQALIESRFDEQRAAGRPLRGKVLKYRQGGISTYATAKLLHRTMTSFGHNAISIADKNDLPKTWLRRCQNWYNQTPKPIRAKLHASNAMEMFFDALESRYWIGSQESQTPGMGYTVHSAHLSEMPAWRSGRITEILDDLTPAIPQHPETMIFFESTGESVGDWWYSSWWASKNGEDDYWALFLPWFLDEDYYLPDLAGDVIDLSPEEKDICKIAELEFGLEIEKAQIAWRRRSIREEPFHGDEVSFNCKFPNTPEQAFLAAGRNVFTAAEVAKARATCRKPVWKGEIEPKDNPAQYNLRGTDAGRLLVWEEPKAGRHYAIGADCQWGDTERSDYDAAFVECIETREVVAQLWGRWNMGLWSKVIASLGHHYNQAVLAPERNSKASDGVVLPLLGQAGNNWRYPNLYVRKTSGKFASRRPQDYGWLTTEHTKPELVAFVHEKQSKELDWADASTVSEMEAYIVNDKAKMTAPEGQHDDRLMARMITAWVANEARGLLLAGQPEVAWGELTQQQARIIEHIEKMDALDEQERAEYEGIFEEW